MNTLMLNKARVVFGAFVAVVFSMLVLAGCSTDGGGGNNDGGLVLGDGWAWVYQTVPGMEVGSIAFIFEKNNNITYCMYQMDWDCEQYGTWSNATGTSVTIKGKGTQTESTMQYNIKDNVLTYGGLEYTKTQIGANPGGDNPGGDNPGGDPNDFVATGGNVVLGANEAWVVEEEGVQTAFIFKLPNEAWGASYVEGYGWVGTQIGTWSASGTSLTVTPFGEQPDITPYSVEGNTLEVLFTEDGESFVMSFTKQTGVTLVEAPSLSKADLVLPAGSAWANIDIEEGFVFRDDGTVWWLFEFDGSWYASDQSSYTINGNTLNMFGYPSWNAIISADGNTLTLDGFEYKKTTGINPVHD